MLEKKVRIQKRQLYVLNTVVKPGSDNKESDDPNKEYGNRKYYALNRKINSKRSKKALWDASIYQLWGFS